jgi:uncharacterized membrane protein
MKYMNTILGTLWLGLTLTWATIFLLGEGTSTFKVVVAISAIIFIAVKIWLMRNWGRFELRKCDAKARLHNQ